MKKRILTTIKTAVMLSLALLPSKAAAPGYKPDRAHKTYIKAVAFRGPFGDQFNVYMFGSAQQLEVRNKKRFDIDYGKVIYLQIDSETHEIMAIKNER